jgi:hypothetical protein
MRAVLPLGLKTDAARLKLLLQGSRFTSYPSYSSPLSHTVQKTRKSSVQQVPSNRGLFTATIRRDNDERWVLHAKERTSAAKRVVAGNQLKRSVNTSWDGPLP